MATQATGPDKLGIATGGYRSSGYPIEGTVQAGVIYGPNGEFTGTASVTASHVAGPGVVSVIEIIGEWLRTVVVPTTLGTLSADITAAAVTATLNAGYDTIPSGVWPVKIGSEVFPATQSGDTITIETGGRGSYGTTAAIHLTGATAYQANLAALVGNNCWALGFPEGFVDSPVAALLYHVVGGSPIQLFGSSRTTRSSIRAPRVLFRVYGGPDARGNYPEAAADMVYRLLAERLETATNEAVTSGVVMSAIEDGEGQLIMDPDTKPSWPYMLTFAELEIRAAA